MIIDDQKRINQKGTIRFGEKKTSASGKTYPSKLETFRLTSPDRRVIEAAAELYGGTAGPWEGQWEVYTTVSDVPIAIMPALMQFDTSYENWSGGVCRARCNGAFDEVRGQSCDCDPDNRVCKSTTRMQVILPDLPGLGTWRVESHGYYARIELAGAVEIVRMAAGLGTILPARLRLEARTVKRLVGDKIETRNFVVPVIDLDVSARELMAIGGGVSASRPAVDGAGGALAPPESVAIAPSPSPALATAPPAPSPSWRAVDQAALPVAPFVSVADQAEEVNRPATRKPRKNAAAPMKPTGLRPPTAAENVCHLCGEPYTEGALIPNRTGRGNRFIHRSCAQPVEGSAVAESRGDGVGDQDGTPKEPASSPDPVLVTAPPEPAAPRQAGETLSHPQKRKLMALTAEAFPVDPTVMSGPDADAMRRERVIALARVLGHRIQSRSDLTKAGAGLVIDALEGIRSGLYRFDGDELVDAQTGESIVGEGA